MFGVHYVFSDNENFSAGEKGGYQEIHTKSIDFNYLVQGENESSEEYFSLILIV